MNSFFHLLFAIVLTFNVSSCQSITKMVKTDENMEDPIFTTPLTTPINMEYNLKERSDIHSLEELKSYLIEHYNLPANWNKKIKSVTTRSSKSDQVIALVLEECNEEKEELNVNKEEDKVFYLKNEEVQVNSPLQEQLTTGKGMFFSIPKTPLSTVKKLEKKIGEKQVNTDIKKVDDKVNQAIVQQKNAEKVTEQLPQVENSEEKTEEILQKKAKKHIAKIHVVEQISKENFSNYLQDALTHATSGTMIILHKNYPVKEKSTKKVKIKIPEFKSRGFRINRLLNQQEFI